MAPSRFLADVPPAHQERVATAALQDLSRDYTLGRGAEAPGFRELNALARAGLIKRHRGELEIVDVPRLARLVEEVDEQ